MNLLIVESPTKAKTISKFLSKDYKIESSFGHIRDLPKTTLGVDTEHNFKPTYLVPKKAKARVDYLNELAKRAKAIYFATDEDREGEAIAWHLSELIKTKLSSKKLSLIPQHRIAFHEITKEAILKSLKNPRPINQHLVDAQQARRILDRLVGYKLSPLLWKKIMRGLSAGRVQSVAVRLIIERENEIKKFKPQEYWTVEGLFAKKAKLSSKKLSFNKDGQFSTTLTEYQNKKLEKFDLDSKKTVDKIVKKISSEKYSVEKISEKETKKRPYAPYKTSTLQQDAYNRLRFSSKQTMMIAQQLYETGQITYMRTDSLILSNKFIDQAKKYLNQHFGEHYSFKVARIFANKTKGAQEAHEAIRPTKINLEPKSIKKQLTPQQYKLYTLIWQRALASLMPEAQISKKIVKIKSKNATFQANGSTIKFDGFLKVYPVKIVENELPELREGQALKLNTALPAQHFTEPPPRYNDASIVKKLEALGIGRPSTYAPTIDTIQKRNYIERDENKRFVPTEIGTLVNNLLEKHFANIVDYDFTAKMENNLDAVAHNKKKWVDVISNFYIPFEKLLEKKYKQIDKQKLTQEKTDIKCPKCEKHTLLVKIGRFGKFLACPGFPECKHTEPVPNDNKTPDNKEANNKESVNSKLRDKMTKNAPDCDKCNVEMILKEGKFGKFWACPNYPKCKNTKNIEQKIAMKCPDCKNGDVVTKRTKRGKIFYGCNKYPDCKFASWKKPEVNQTSKIKHQKLK